MRHRSFWISSLVVYACAAAALALVILADPPGALPEPPGAGRPLVVLTVTWSGPHADLAIAWLPILLCTALLARAARASSNAAPYQWVEVIGSGIALLALGCLAWPTDALEPPFALRAAAGCVAVMALAGLVPVPSRDAPRETAGG